ncbi:MAG: hypothetical protein IPF93_14175, partial [Saprospiraceae bacterium]|nr:hypothetical protein [Saprospiraceae bacterium]
LFLWKVKVGLPPCRHLIFPTPIIDKAFKVDAGLVAMGEKEYGPCRGCHGGNVVSMGMAPDLRASAVPLNLDLFRQVVKKDQV